MWEMWKEWHWNRNRSLKTQAYFGFPPPLSFYQCPILKTSFIYHRRCIVLAIDGVVTYISLFLIT
jgi:hypothetical protein